MKKRTTLLLAFGGLALAGIAALAQGGIFQGYPIVGRASYCASTNNNVCTSTIPAGPTAITGNEVVPADTQLGSGQNPQTVGIPTSVLAAIGQGSNRNALIGGDFATNLWQRGATLSSLTPTTAAYTADRWFVYSSGNTVTVSRQTGATDISLANGVLATMRVNRPSGTDVTPICVGQILPAKESGRFLGNNAIFSFFAQVASGTNLSSVNDAVDVTIAYGTATDSTTPNTNTDAFAKGTLTGYTAVTSTNIPLVNGFARYSISGAIPTTATTIGVKICMTNVGTGASTDWFEFGNAQLEASVTSNTSPGSFARRSVAEETVLQQSYSFVLTDGAATIRYPGWCVETTANTSAMCTISFPTMRMTPSTTIATAASFSAQTASGAANVCTALTAISTSNSANSAGLLCTAAGTVAAGVASTFIGQATGALLTFSAEP